MGRATTLPPTRTAKSASAIYVRLSIGSVLFTRSMTAVPHPGVELVSAEPSLDADQSPASHPLTIATTPR